MSIPKAARVHGVSDPTGRALDASAILRYWRPGNILLDCSIPAEYSKEANCFFKKYYDWSLNDEEFLYCKNR